MTKTKDPDNLLDCLDITEESGKKIMKYARFLFFEYNIHSDSLKELMAKYQGAELALACYTYGIVTHKYSDPLLINKN